MIKSLKRYLRLLYIFARNSLMRELEFKLSFLSETLAYLLWGVLNIVFFGFIYGHVDQVLGWDLKSMYVLVATYLLVKTATQTLFQPSLKRINSLVVDGRLDLVLTKPVSSQFYVSLGRLRPEGFIRVLFVLCIFYLLYLRADLKPNLSSLLAFCLFIVISILIFYSLWFMTVITVFWFGRVNNIVYISKPMMNLAKVPIDAYPRFLSFFLTFIIPIIFVTTIPAKILLGEFSLLWLIFGVISSLALLLISHKFWNLALKRYSSAGG